MMTEVAYKDCKDFYEVSNTGLVRSKERLAYHHQSGVKRVKSKNMKPRTDKDGYLLISLYNNGRQENFRVHRLVAEAFIPNPDSKPFVNHKDGNKANNAVSNLEWCTQSENEVHAIEQLGKSQPKGAESQLSTKMLVTMPDGTQEIMYGQNEVARRYGLAQGNIWKVLHGRSSHHKGYRFEFIQ